MSLSSSFAVGAVGKLSPSQSDEYKDNYLDSSVAHGQWIDRDQFSKIVDISARSLKQSLYAPELQRRPPTNQLQKPLRFPNPKANHAPLLYLMIPMKRS